MAEYRKVMDAHLLHEGASQAWRLVDRANRFVEETAPWNLAKQGDQDRLKIALGALGRAVARITILAGPYMPSKTQVVWAALGLGGATSGAAWQDLDRPPVGGRSVQKLAPLFPKAGAESLNN